MKRRIKKMIALSLAVLLLLSMAACGTDKPQTTTLPQTDPPVHTTAPTTAPDDTTAATEPDPQVWDAAYFEKLLNKELYRSEHDWYNMALTSYYESPEQINLYYLFYGGFLNQDPKEPTPEEKAYLEGEHGFIEPYELHRLPVADMDAILQEYFDITLNETDQIGLEDLVYWEKTDCYYSGHTDALGVSDVVVTNIEVQTDGTYKVSYETGDSMIGSSVVVMRPVYHDWQFVSNLPAQ